MNAKKVSKETKEDKAAAKRILAADRTKKDQPVKALRNLTNEETECVRGSMTALKDGYTLISPNDMVDHFDTLREFGMAKDSRFNRTTGKPELKKVLTKKGQKVFKYLFPKPSTLGR
jgi:hypothetical protein